MAVPSANEFAIDIETDGFKATKIHSLVISHLATGEIFSCADQPGYLSIDDGLSLLQAKDVHLIGHNITTFDVPWLRKLRGLQVPREALFDTLTGCRILWPDPREEDARNPHMPTTLVGKHSLEAWGYRIGARKGGFGKQTDWHEWSPEMQTYCVQDVAVTCALYHRIVDAL